MIIGIYYILNENFDAKQYERKNHMLFAYTQTHDAIHMCVNSHWICK